MTGKGEDDEIVVITGKEKYTDHMQKSSRPISPMTSTGRRSKEE
jgi:hypothetical protein